MPQCLHTRMRRARPEPLWTWFSVSCSSSHRLQLADPFPRKTRGPLAEEASAIDALSMPLLNPCTKKKPPDFPLSVTNEYLRVGGVNYCTNCTIPVRSRGARSTYQIHLFSLMLFLFQSTSHNREHIVYKKVLRFATAQGWSSHFTSMLSTTEIQKRRASSTEMLTVCHLCGQFPANKFLRTTLGTMRFSIS
jgi:hypothetical protein